MITHELMGGKLHVYKRENSRYWQCSTFLNGKNRRVSTKEESLAHAKQFAEDWYLELRGKSRAGLLTNEKTFEQAADQFLKEYEVITEGQRSPKWVSGYRDRLPHQRRDDREVLCGSHQEHAGCFSDQCDAVESAKGEAEDRAALAGNL
ncbi:MULTISPECIES: hypothetical protein [Bradyrhizobium]|uniref:hypothetical protein n=1 Tax=Bradyrhizobium TaxID=374 RepID=UPI001586D570|nr:MULTISPECIES: hypothetical protein [Bradyrhizobium]